MKGRNERKGASDFFRIPGNPLTAKDKSSSLSTTKPQAANIFDPKSLHEVNQYTMCSVLCMYPFSNGLYFTVSFSPILIRGAHAAAILFKVKIVKA